jgi:hypothetical protein
VRHLVHGGTQSGQYRTVSDDAHLHIVAVWRRGMAIASPREPVRVTFRRWSRTAR